MKAFLISLLLTVGILPEDGCTARYSAIIEMPRGYISGVCVMRRDGDALMGSLVNEFGFSMLDFVHNGAKTDILSSGNLLDNRRIKKILARDLTALFAGMAEGRDTYTNDRKNITYRFTALEK